VFLAKKKDEIKNAINKNDDNSSANKDDKDKNKDKTEMKDKDEDDDNVDYEINRNEEAVLKLIEKPKRKDKDSERIEKMIESELKVGMMIGKKSPFLVHYKQTFEHKGFVCFVMEYCSGGSISDLIEKGKKFTEKV
jgi:serine/threonine protein kinase